MASGEPGYVAAHTVATVSELAAPLRQSAAAFSVVKYVEATYRSYVVHKC